MKKKGFTLIELLAVIIILAISLVIAIPQIQKVIAGSKEKTFITNAKAIVRKIIYDDVNFTSSSLSALGLSGLDDNYDLDNSMAYMADGEVYVNLVGKNKYAGMYVMLLYHLII